MKVILLEYLGQKRAWRYYFKQKSKNNPEQTLLIRAFVATVEMLLSYALIILKRPQHFMVAFEFGEDLFLLTEFAFDGVYYTHINSKLFDKVFVQSANRTVVLERKLETFTLIHEVLLTERFVTGIILEYIRCFLHKEVPINCMTYIQFLLDFPVVNIHPSEFMDSMENYNRKYN